MPGAREPSQRSAASVQASPDPATLAGVALVRGLSSEELFKLASMMHRRSFPTGTNVSAAKERGESAYVTRGGLRQGPRERL